MLTLEPVPAGEPRAQALLDEYMADRARTWTATDRAYAPKPAPAAQLSPPIGAFLIARLGGEDVGCGGVRRIERESGAWFEIKHLYVRPTARGHGVGRALLTGLESAAIALGATDLVLDTNRSLEAAGGLYARAGYEATEPFNDNPNATDWYRKRVSAR